MSTRSGRVEVSTFPSLTFLPDSKIIVIRVDKLDSFPAPALELVSSRAREAGLRSKGCELESYSLQER